MKYDVIITQTLGKGKYNEINWHIIDQDKVFQFKSYLSSIAVLNYLREKGLDPLLIILLPMSLFDISDLDNTIELCRDSKHIENLAIDILKDTEIHDQLNKYNVKYYVIPSFGIYRKKVLTKFIADPDTIETCIFSILYSYLSKSYGYLYYDVSTGWNQYNLIISDAVRAMVTYSKLKSLFRNSISAYEVQAEPVTNVKESNIYFKPIDAKAFFIIPFKIERLKRLGEISKLTNYIKPYENNIDDAIHIQKKGVDSNFSSMVKKLLNDLRKLYNGVTLNTPLALLDHDITDVTIDPNELEKIFYNHLIEFMKYDYHIDNNIIVLRWRRMSFDEIRKLYYSIALYSGLRGKILDIRNKAVRDGWVDLENLRKSFSELYDDLNLELNKRFLNRDIEEIKFKVKRWRDEYQTDIFQLKLLYDCIKDVGAPDIKRNFFAHSGLERSMVELNIKKDDILIRYMDKISAGDKETKIKKLVTRWIEKPD